MAFAAPHGTVRATKAAGRASRRTGHHSRTRIKRGHPIMIIFT
ncbi:hypothetical protein X949_5234 [Burkholderia pseudomallei MSHR5609]|nr:hypothetical protein X989_4484 [Burkholderia pseudomallei MSHR4378]KGS30099.1 hypothetical protein X962_2879 [Burkholderia pseudomallei MSHR7343]KGS54579.1 hypothetical protein X949_5234 [Burkholderia pseudomallei MSHR5609]KGS83656.1 hypothetical protein X976_4122 [Burkholderia pseudomallei MSHR7500]KGX59489.1 hypothetical protein Y024_3716 [Burkholderia pseudomallei TSV44]KGY02126.1 hypothetical protein Y023_2557 [Burkholderia pseudomallei A79D]KOS99788.1 hypothetical protein DM50_1925 [B